MNEVVMIDGEKGDGKREGISEKKCSDIFRFCSTIQLIPYALLILASNILLSLPCRCLVFI